MKPPRRLGKGLADLMSLQTGLDGDEGGAAGDTAAPSILQLLSTPPVDDAVGEPPSAESPHEAPLTRVEAPARVEPAPTPPEPADPAPLDPVVAATEPVGAPPPPAAATDPVELADVSSLAPDFVDEWFDPPIAAFSPAAGFERIESPEPAPVPRTPAPPRAAAAPTPPPPPVEPVPPAPPPAPVVLLDDDELLVDEFVVGAHLPEIDLDS